LAEGQQAEVNLRMLDWVDALVGDLERGYVLVLDYGADSGELYGADRMTGTLRAFQAQQVSSDSLHGVGHRDITASVDFGALERHSRAAGLVVHGRRRLNEFLIAAGLDDTYAAARAEADSDWDSAAMLRSAVRRLLDPGALGGYQVAVLGRNTAHAPPLAGLQPLPGRASAR
jgi:SAM-dependent MidA family methyltransferase